MVRLCHAPPARPLTRRRAAPPPASAAPAPHGGRPGRSRAARGSDVWMPEGGRLTLYAPAATGNLTRCAPSCFSAGAADVATGVLTTPALQGARARSGRPSVALWLFLRACTEIAARVVRHCRSSACTEVLRLPQRWQPASCSATRWQRLHRSTAGWGRPPRRAVRARCASVRTRPAREACTLSTPLISIPLRFNALGYPTSAPAAAQARRWHWSTASRPWPCRASRPPAPSSASPASCRRALAAPLVRPCRQADGRGRCY